MPSVTVSFSLDTQKHATLLEWLEGQENASQAIRQALDEHVQGQVRIVDVYREVQSLRRIVTDLEKRGLAVAQVEEPEQVGDEPPEVAAALDGLGLD